MFLDIVCKNGVLIVQFVDDSFILQSTMFGMRCVNKALSNFSYRWRHRFKAGTKGPSILAVACAGADGHLCGNVDGIVPSLVPKMQVLGLWIDSGLVLQEQLDQVCGRLMDGAQALVRRMNDLGLGLPCQVAQFGARVKQSAFHGVEAQRSCWEPARVSLWVRVDTSACLPNHGS